MSDSKKSPQEVLEESLKHSARLSEININVDARALPCGFPTIERYEYLMEKEGNLVIIAARPGNGKCHKIDTQILMFDGSIKKVQDIVVGDLVMGPDSKPRTVLSLGRGREEMYKITPTKGESFVVNKSHILSLKISSTYSKEHTKGQVVNLTVEDYLTKNSKFKHQAKLWRTGVEFEPKELEYDPYWVGLWLGDGSVGKTEITKDEPELWAYYEEFSKEYGLTISKKSPENRCHGASFIVGKGNVNPLLNFVRGLVVNSEKRVPRNYLTSSRDQRLRLLAGLLDSDGYFSDGYFEISTKHKGLSEDILYLARSLGFAAYCKIKNKSIKETGFTGQYYIISISGDVSLIPTKIKRKQASIRLQKKNVLLTGFTVESVGEDDFYGFTLDGDHLYLMGDFTVTHNTALACQIGFNVAKWGRVLYFSLEMKKEALRKRLLAVSSGVPIKKLNLPVYRDKVENALKEQASYKFDIVDDGGLDVSSIIRYINDEMRREPVDLVIIDYIGLVRVDNSNRHVHIGDVAKRLKKEVADKWRIPVIALAQMKRGFEDRYAKAKLEYEKSKGYSSSTPNPKILDLRPSLEDLGESSGLEHCADVVMFLHRPYLLDPEEPPSLFKVFIAKNRNGEVKDFNLEFTQSLTSFRDVEI